MPIYEKQTKPADTILSELQAIDPGITGVKVSPGNMYVNTSTNLDATTKNALLAYSLFILVEIPCEDTTMFKE